MARVRSDAAGIHRRLAAGLRESGASRAPGCVIVCTRVLRVEAALVMQDLDAAVALVRLALP